MPMCIAQAYTIPFHVGNRTRYSEIRNTRGKCDLMWKDVALLCVV